MNNDKDFEAVRDSAASDSDNEMPERRRTPAAPVVAEGWALVPITPTPEMSTSGKHALKGAVDLPTERAQAECVYGAMVLAAQRSSPAPTAGGVFASMADHVDRMEQQALNQHVQWFLKQDTMPGWGTLRMNQPTTPNTVEDFLPLPKTEHCIDTYHDDARVTSQDGYTADQMRAYILADRAQRPIAASPAAGGGNVLPPTRGTEVPRDADGNYFSLGDLRALVDGIRPGDGWGGDDWEHALINAAANELAARFRAAGRNAQPEQPASPTVAGSVDTPDWMECERISDLPRVDDALHAFSEDPTADNATGVIKAAFEARLAPTSPGLPAQAVPEGGGDGK